MNDLQSAPILLLLFFLGWLSASTISGALKHFPFIRSEERSFKEFLPRIPFSLRYSFRNAIFGISILFLTPLTVYTVMNETVKESWFIPFFIPYIIYLLLSAAYILNRDKKEIELYRAELDKSDRHQSILNICKKLSNRESKSCRKTNTQQYNSILHYLKNDQNPDEVFENRYTLLLPSACCGDYKLVKSLIEHGSNVNFRSSEGNCAIHLASKYGFEEIVELLINSGADTKVEDADGKTALMYASQNGFKDIEAMLKRAEEADTEG